ncbi:hypothetical protein Tco_0677760 [Tanacetum coccineum]|uniref:Uncharacterized protein n=1 Tax=Tanacetum coccineum TaxID=301880 RepID=A0ABQ4XEG6_9ASTR
MVSGNTIPGDMSPEKKERENLPPGFSLIFCVWQKRLGTGGSNEGTGNILGVPDESTVISRASSEGTGSKPGVPDEEKLIL